MNTNESDRELLELAAKAARYKRLEYRDDVPYVSMGHAPTDDWMPWNPLTDDGDALRLAVKLNLQVSIAFEDFMHDREFAEVRWDTVDGREFQLREHGQDAYAATRRAIVCAAAEIGRNQT